MAGTWKTWVLTPARRAAPAGAARAGFRLVKADLAELKQFQRTPKTRAIGRVYWEVVRRPRARAVERGIARTKLPPW